MKLRAFLLLLALSTGPALATEPTGFDPELEDDAPDAKAPDAKSPDEKFGGARPVPLAEKAPEKKAAPAKAPEEKAPSAKSPDEKFGGARPVPFAEKAPADLERYLKGNRTPAYVRVNVRGHKLREQPDSSGAGSAAAAGDIYPVTQLKRLERGVAVEVLVNGERRWLYLASDGTKGDFQFCETDACLAATLADSFDFLLSGSGVGVTQAKACGVGSGPEGLLLPPGAGRLAGEPTREAPRDTTKETKNGLVAQVDAVDSTPDDAASRESKSGLAAHAEPAVARPAAPAARAPVREAARETKINPTPRTEGAFRPTVTPLWERARGKQGEQLTSILSTALDRHGQKLLQQKTITDAKIFCPNYSRLTPHQRKEFYVHLFNGVARYESNFKLGPPAFDEHRYAKRKKPYDLYRGPLRPKGLSMGLFQLNHSAADGYKPPCRIDYNKDRGKDISDRSLTIYDPQIQAECAVAIMSRWVSRDGGIGYTQDVYDRRIGGKRFRGGANYWSTLRNINPASREIIASLKKFTPCWGKGGPK